MLTGLIVGIVAVLIYLASRGIDRQAKDKQIPDEVLRWKSAAQRISNETQVPANIILAVLWTESDGNPGAVGSAGEKGLMQLKPIAVKDVEGYYGINASGWDVEPEKNILIGAYYLKRQEQRTGSWSDAIKAYNQGYDGAQKNIELANEYFQKVNSRIGLIS